MKPTKEFRGLVNGLPEGQRKVIMKRYIKFKDETEDKETKSGGEDIAESPETNNKE